MTTLLKAQPSPSASATIKTVEDLLRELGDIPARRVLMHPLPGTATERDLVRKVEAEDLLVELVDGTLVEKPVGIREGIRAGAVLAALRDFVLPRNLGIVSGPDTTLQILTGSVGLPDVSYISWNRLPGGKVPQEPVPAISPDLAVEVLSESNSRAEMSRKRREYFDSGTSLVWEIDRERRRAAAYTAPEACISIDVDGSLDGGNVLPGFSLSLGKLFAELDRVAPGDGGAPTGHRE